jgi:glycosyltransferase involved in cell wall biosynthesis
MNIITFDKGGRDQRVAQITEGTAPRDFFYGTLDLTELGHDVERIPSGTSYVGIWGSCRQWVETLHSRITGLGLRPHRARQLKCRLQAAEVAISFTDGFSLSLGHAYHAETRGVATLVGFFHRLCDIEDNAGRFCQTWVRRRIRRAVHRLDRLVFFGPADREEAIVRYAIPREKTSIFIHGFDTDFWEPTGEPEEDFYFSPGQDPNRDFQLLADCGVDLPLHIHTSLPVRVKPGNQNIKLSHGNYYQSSLTDTGLRSVYCRSRAVVVPLQNVLQPSGYSVTMQAMACGKPVVLTRNRGLWAPEYFVDGENCILVPPGDSPALAAALRQLEGDAGLRTRMGEAARKTVLKYFPHTKNLESLRAAIAGL